MSICQALLNQVTDIVRLQGACAVDRITIEWGPLSGVDSESLQHAFAVMRLKGVAAEAVLCVEAVAVAVCCISCSAVSPALWNRLVCAVCGGYRTRVVAGDELRLRQVVMRMPETARAD